MKETIKGCRKLAWEDNKNFEPEESTVDFFEMVEEGMKDSEKVKKSDIIRIVKNYINPSSKLLFYEKPPKVVCDFCHYMIDYLLCQ